MNIIGIHGALDWDPTDILTKNRIHDAGATLFVDGKHIRSIDEERLSRTKWDGNFPYKSIDYCLGDIPKEDVDIVCFVPSSVDLCHRQTMSGEANKKIRNVFPNAEVWFVGHHLCHAASTVFTAPFNSGSFLTLDGFGSGIWDFADASIKGTENNSIGYFDKDKRIFRFFRMQGGLGENSFGDYYACMASNIFTEKTGVHNDKYNNAEGKIMGLSAYGKYDTTKDQPYTKSTEVAKEAFGIDRYEFGLPIVNFYDYGLVLDHLKAWDKPNAKWKYTPEDKAYFMQKNYEDAFLYLISELREDYLEDNVCFAGGCFLNINTNTLVRDMFTNMHVVPFANDTGVHFGAAVWASYKLNYTIEMPTNIALLGRSYDYSEVLGC